MSAAEQAKRMREEAFESGMGNAGLLLKSELAKAERRAEHYPDEAARIKRAAWERYCESGNRVGDAYRAAMAAEQAQQPQFSYLSLYYVHVPDITGENWAYPHTSSEMFTTMAAYQAKVIELAALPNVRLESTFIHRS